MRLDHLLSKRKGYVHVYVQGKAKALNKSNNSKDFILSFYPDIFYITGELAQLARASALQAECQGFKSPILH